jgi:hypothetical protein
MAIETTPELIDKGRMVAPAPRLVLRIDLIHGQTEATSAARRAEAAVKDEAELSTISRNGRL